MSDIFHNARITVKGISTDTVGASIKYTITDNNDSKYSFFQTKQDGTPSAAYESFIARKITIGSDTGISFVLKENPKNAEYPFKNIVSFSDPESIEHNQNDGRPTYTRQGSVLTPNTPNIPSSSQTLPQGAKIAFRDYEAEARGKVRYGFLLEAYKKEWQLTPELMEHIHRWTEASMTGEILDELSVSDSPTPEEPPF